MLLGGASGFAVWAVPPGRTFAGAASGRSIVGVGGGFEGFEGEEEEEEVVVVVVVVLLLLLLGDKVMLDRGSWDFRCGVELMSLIINPYSGGLADHSSPRAVYENIGSRLTILNQRTCASCPTL